MKILKKFLVIFIFSSLFFINNTNAATTSNKYTIIKYKDEYIEPMNDFLDSTLYNNLISYINNNMTHYQVSSNNYVDFTNNYIMYISLNNFTSSSTRIAVSFSSGFSYIDGSIWYDGYENGRMWLYNSTTYRFYFYFDNNYNITSINMFNQGGYNITYTIYNDRDTGNYITYPDYPIYIDKTFYNDTSGTIRFQYDNGNALTNIPIKIYDTVYTPTLNNDALIPSLNYIDSLNDSLEPESNEPILYEPQIESFNGYNKVTYYIYNYTLNSAIDGYFVRIVNNTNGTIDNIAPDVNNTDQIISKNYYENVSLSIQVHDRNYNILSDYDINTNINYQNDSDYSIRINSVSNEQRIVYYDYLIKNNNNVKCYYSINNNNFIEDSNCTDSTYTYYLQLGGNGSITWEIRDLQNNVLYNYSQNFVFNVANPFINFKDNFNNDFLNLDVLINRYESGDIVEYSINNSQFMQVNYIEDYSVNQNIKYFTINNVNDNDLIVVRVKRNNEIITTAKYRANYLKYSNDSNENFNISNIFNKISINNINEELKNYIKNFGNLILNSKIGNLLLLDAFCLIVTIIIKMIRN